VGEKPTSDALARAFEAVLADLSPGEVVTYGWVAAAAGHPGLHRAVGTFLAHRYDGPNWWLVVGSDRKLHAPDAAQQTALLRDDGVRVEDGRVVGPVKRP
jgi:methylated-DNA-protein-cysteine methyltransferase-like protein